jgi:phosphoglycolate phosphatase-like HAD superfamily hydrolase
MSRPKTLILDIDGTLVEHVPPSVAQTPQHTMRLLPNPRERLIEWDRKGYNIILLTGRRESLREETVRQLSEVGIFYDQLIMGVGGGPRILINDKKPTGEATAFHYNPERNVGVGDIQI